ncbi:MAG: AbrB/MazE/SpoVT family DNA-binding domain-containing protein [Nanoarchaeota archaeon]|nr:AbrB/MazE/SpoVT family DNA-binding domain-containing protein [Nanoarchaeota archaeon]
MVEIGITRMSSKGQIVIPQGMRLGISEGERILIIQGENSLILKRATKMDEQFQEDLEFARRTEEAYKRIEAGEGIRMDVDEFLEEMGKW